MESENSSDNNAIYRFGPFRLNAGERQLTRDGRIVVLRPKTFDLLLILVREANHFLSREALIHALWPDTIVEEHNLTVNINRLRKLLDDDDERSCIETVRGHGYRFIAEVIQENSPSADVGSGASGEMDEAAASANGRRIPAGKSVGFMIGGIILIGALLAGYFVLFASNGNRRPVATAAAASIAVLPFENLSADKSNAYFVRGIQDLIITKLAGIGSLKVISRTSTEHYSSHPDDLRAIARQLGVATILEGSVQKEGDRVLINLQLIDAKTDSHIWAQAYTRKLDNVFDVESMVAQEVANALKLQLFPQEEKWLAQVPTDNPKAYDLFLRADYLAAQVETRKADNPARMAAQAENLYRQALAQDPGFALAQARLSMLDSYVYGYYLDRSSERVMEARKAAAAAIKSGLPQGHLAMGYVYYRGYRDYGKALAEFKHTRRMLPNNVAAIGAIALVQRRRGRWNAALNKLRRAELLDPRNPLWHLARGETLAQLRRYTEAEEEFDHAFSLAPQYNLALIYKSSAQLLSGDIAAARHSLGKIPSGAHLRGMLRAANFNSALLGRHPDAAMATLAPVTATTILSQFMVGAVPTDLLRARAWLLKGNSVEARSHFEQARKTLTQLLQRRPDDPNLLSFLGLAEAGLGHAAAAIRFASRAVKLLPISKDALYGPSHLTALAAVYAQSGRPNLAIKQLNRLLAIPAGMNISVPLLKLDPTWDPIRHDPAFQALLKRYAPGKRADFKTQTSANDTLVQKKHLSWERALR